MSKLVNPQTYTYGRAGSCSISMSAAFHAPGVRDDVREHVHVRTASVFLVEWLDRDARVLGAGRGGESNGRQRSERNQTTHSYSPE